MESDSGCVAVDREQDRHVGPGGIGLIDTRVCAHQAVARLADHHAVAVAHDAHALAQHQLDDPRILVVLLGNATRLFGGLDIVELDETALGLGDDLLADHEDTVGKLDGAGRRVGASRIIVRR